MANSYTSRQLTFADENNDKKSISVMILEVLLLNMNKKYLFIHVCCFFFLSRHSIHQHPMVYIYGLVHLYLHNIFGIIETILSAKTSSRCSNL